jgi:hypothetical protein
VKACSPSLSLQLNMTDVVAPPCDTPNDEDFVCNFIQSGRPAVVEHLRVHLHLSSWTHHLLSKPFPMLQSLDLAHQATAPSSPAFELPHELFRNTPRLQHLRLRKCSLPRGEAFIDDLTSLSLTRPTPLAVHEFLPILQRLPRIEHLELVDVFRFHHGPPSGRILAIPAPLRRLKTLRLDNPGDALHSFLREISTPATTSLSVNIPESSGPLSEVLDCQPIRAFITHQTTRMNTVLLASRGNAFEMHARSADPGDGSSLDIAMSWAKPPDMCLRTALRALRGCAPHALSIFSDTQVASLSPDDWAPHLTTTLRRLDVSGVCALELLYHLVRRKDAPLALPALETLRIARVDFMQRDTQFPGEPEARPLLTVLNHWLGYRAAAQRMLSTLAIEGCRGFMDTHRLHMLAARYVGRVDWDEQQLAVLL